MLTPPRCQCPLPVLGACGLLLALAGCAYESPFPAPPPPAPLFPTTPADPRNDQPRAPDRAPLTPITFEEWPGCYRLTNAALELVIAPGVGRIVHLAIPGQPTLLNRHENMRGHRFQPGETFANIGGDWMWPIAQSHWTTLADSNWPPPLALAESRWDGGAWANPDGSQSCLLLRRYAPPINLIVTRLITLDRDLPRVRILQRAVSVGLSDLPVTLWNVSQMRAPSRLYMPADTNVPSGVKVMQFDAVPPARLQRVDDIVVFDTEGPGEFKLGVGARPAWVAAQIDNVVVIERAEHKLKGIPPDGCSVEIYANQGLGYAEIELLTPEQVLDAGGRVESTVVIDCLPLPARTRLDEAARNVRDWALPPSR